MKTQTRMKKLKQAAQAAFLLVMMVVAGENAFSQKTWDGGAGTSNWGDANNWNPDGIPTALQTVTISNNGTLTVNVNGTYSCSTLTMTYSGTSNGLITLSIASSNSLTVSGDATLNYSAGNGSERVTIDIAGGTFNCANLYLNQRTADTQDTYLFISNAGSIANVSGNITMQGTNSRNYIYFTAGGTLNVGGTITGGGITSTAGGGAAAPTSGTVNYNNATTQNIGTYTYYNLQTSNGGTKSLVGSVTVNNQLILTSGIFALGTNNLTLGASATISGTPSVTNMVDAESTGQFIKTFSSGDVAAFTFPVGETTGTNEYSPVTIDFSANSGGNLGVRVTDGSHASLGTPADYISRYWSFTSTIATYTYTGNLNYLAADITGSEANMRLNIWNGAWTNILSSSVATNQITIPSALNETTGTLNGRDFTAMTNSVVIKTVPYSHNFDTQDSWSTSGTAGIWERGDQTNTSFGPPSGHSGNTVYGTRLNANYATDNVDAYLVTPIIDLAGTTGPLLSFWMDMESETGFDGGVLRISVNSGAWTTIALADYITGGPAQTSIDGLGDGIGWSGIVPAGDWQEVSLALFDLTNTGLVITSSDLVQVQFWFGSDSSVSDKPGWYIDDFSIADLVACTEPVCQASNLILTPTNSTVGGTFTSGACAPSGYLVIRNTTGTTPSPVDGTTYIAGGTVGAGNTVVQSSSSTAFNDSGLSENTQYYYFIFAYNNTNCTGGPEYNLVSPLNGSSTTLTCTVTSYPFSEDFESITSANTLPACMAATNIGTSVYTYITSGTYNRIPHSGTDFASFEYSCDDYVFTQPFDLTAGTTYKFSFWYITDGYSGWTTLEARYGNAQNAGAMTGAITGASISNPTNTSYAQLSGTFTPAVSGVYYIGIHCVANATPWYLSIDDFNVYIPNDQTTIVQNPGTQVAAGNISSLAVSNAAAVDVFKFRVTDAGTADGLPTYVTRFVVKKQAGTADWTDHIAGAELWNDGAVISNLSYTVTDTEITFTKTTGSFDVANATSEELTMKIWLNTSNIVDNSTMSFTVSQTASGFSSLVTGSEFASDFGSATNSNTFTVRVTATQLEFTTQPSAVATSGVALAQQPAVSATDVYGNVDIDFTGTVTLSNSGALTMTNNSVAAVAGIATFATFTFTSGGKYVMLNASSGALSSPVPSSEIAVDIIGCILFSENFNTYSNGNLPNGALLELITTASANQWTISNSGTTINGTRNLAIYNGTDNTYTANNDADKTAYFSTTINASNYKNLSVSFTWLCNGETNYDYASVVYSLDNGTTWQNASSTHLNNSGSSTVANIDLSALDGQQFLLGFRWINDASGGSNPPILIDDIVVRGFPAFNYNFSYRSDNFETITGTIVTPDATEGANINLPSGFDFQYEGTAVTALRANLNGWMQIGTSYVANAAPTNNLYDMTQIPFLAPLWDDLTYDAQTKVTYLATGTAPTRVFTVEWYDVLWGGQRQNFQIKLYETSDMIEFHYGNMNNPSSGSASIGINNLIAGSCMNKIISITPGSTPTASYTSENNMINSAANIPSGTVYVFNPNFMQTYTSWQAASVCIGQATWSAQSSALDQSTTSSPSSAAISSKNVLAVGQQGVGLTPPMTNGRIMLWNSTPTTNGAAADVVLGKSNFTDDVGGCTADRVNSINGVCYTPDGEKLIGVDYGNNRILIWNSIPTVNGTPADVVVGQPDFTTNSAGTSNAKFDGPLDAIVLPNGKLLVSDAGNNRVLVFNAVPTINGTAADFVIGQTNFTNNTSGGGTTGLNGPWGLSFSPEGKLFIADRVNERILVYNTVPSTNGAAADMVIGQTDFTTYSTGTSRTKFNRPLGVTISPEGKMAVCEFFNHRAMVYNRVPNTNGGVADVVLGQPNFYEAYIFNDGVSQMDLTTPDNRNMQYAYATRFDLNGRLLLVGRDMMRVMLYGVAPTSTADIALTITSNETDVCVYSEVSYTVNITNNGPDPAYSVVVNAQLPVGFTATDYEAAIGTYNTSSGYWMIPYIANGQTLTLTFTGTVNPALSGKSVTAYANIVASSQKDSNYGNNGANQVVVVKVFSAPTFTAIPDQYINRNSHTIPVVSFTVDDVDGLSDISAYTCTSSNTTLVPVNYTTNLIFAGIVPDKSLDIVPVTDQYGFADMTLRVTDSHGCYTQKDFQVVVGNIWKGGSAMVLGGETDWHQALNWTGGVPTTTMEAIIPTVPEGGYFPIIKNNAVCSDLLIEPKSKVTLNDGFRLDVVNEFRIESDNTGTGSFVDFNSTTGNATVGGNAIAERYFTTGSWHYFSTPLKSVTNKVITQDMCSLYNGNVIQYDQSYSGDVNLDGSIDMLDGWQWPWYYTPNNNNFEVAKGYAAYLFPTTCTNLATFTDNTSADNAKLNSGGISISISNQNATEFGADGYLGRGWNLIGNPYPSGISATAFINANSDIDGNLYFWGKGGTTGFTPADYATFNLVGTTSGGAASLPVPDDYISIGQAFVVRKTATGVGSATFSNAMRQTENSYYYKGSEDVWKLYLLVESPEKDYNDILVAFKENATDEADFGYDALKVKGNKNLAFYSEIHELKYAIQTLPFIQKDEEKIVPIGLDITVAGTYHFSLQSMQYFPDDVQVFFVDLQTHHEYNLRKTSIIEVEIENAGNITDRFQLIFFKNQTPQIAETIENKTVLEDLPMNVSISRSLFTDDQIEPLEISVALQNNSNLPSWMTFDSENLTISGMPENSQVGEYPINIVAQDKYGYTAETSFLLTVQNVNDAPLLTTALEDVSMNAGETAEYEIPFNTFVDIDAGDQLTLSATMAEGTNLPEWIYFNSENQTLRFAPADENSGLYSIRVTAIDMALATSFDVFELMVLGTSNLIAPDGSSAKLYPNPNNGTFRIILSESEPATITVSDISGRIIYETSSSSTETNLTLRNTKNGMYFVKIRTHEKSFIGTVIINK